MNDDLCELERKLQNFGLTVRRGVSFKTLTTLGCGGNAALAAYPKNVRQFVSGVEAAKKSKVPYFILGRGSKVLSSDNDYAGVVFVTVLMNKVTFCGNSAVCEAGVNTAVFAALCAKRGLMGAEFLYCLPATVGGAAVMNAGCFGQNMAGVVKSVKALLPDGRVKVLSAKRCNFRYRQSVFKSGDFAVLEVRFRFTKGEPAKIRQKMVNNYMLKASSQPLKERSAGSALYCETAAASKLIDMCNLKGFRLGGAEVSCKHAGFVINVDNASGEDVYLLIRFLQKTLKKTYGVRTEIEIRTVGFEEK